MAKRRIRYTSDQPPGEKLKEMPCLKCGKKFRTWKGKRICDRCQEANDHLVVRRAFRISV